MSERGLPASGSVLGVDIGFSPTRRSSAVCRLSWTDADLTWLIRRHRAVPSEQLATLQAVAGTHRLLAAAFDGPLRAGLDQIGRYRLAEQLLTRILGKKIGKPGQASAPIGRKLNDAANDSARLVLSHLTIAAARHPQSISDFAIVEAFPSSFLGVMLDAPMSLTVQRGNRSDTYFRHLCHDGRLLRLVHHLLPGRRLLEPIDSVFNHDDRAALICALTALAVVANDYTAVGDANGWIMLPPPGFVQDWAHADIASNTALNSPASWYFTKPPI